MPSRIFTLLAFRQLAIDSYFFIVSWFRLHYITFGLSCCHCIIFGVGWSGDACRLRHYGDVLPTLPSICHVISYARQITLSFVIAYWMPSWVGWIGCRHYCYDNIATYPFAISVEPSFSVMPLLFTYFRFCILL